jgi:predicted nucleotidyltransferase
VDRLVDEVVGVFAPVEVWLFGSVARSEDDGHSDIDLVVVLDRYDPNDAVALKVRAGRSFSVPAPFDVVFTDPNRVQRRRRIAGTLERAACAHGRLMYRRA